MSQSGQRASEYSLTEKDNILMDGYRKSIKDGQIRVDPDQEEVIHELQNIYDQLIKTPAPIKPKKTLARFFSKSKNDPVLHKIKGLYLWGGVGRGKTHLVDFFYDQLPIENKMRLHFHRFMQIVHDEMGTLDSIPDPLEQVAKSFARRTRVLCLDELHVIDITDAMILGRFFQYLFDEGLILITTSNFHPDNLYKNGLQRDRFLPAIELLKENTKMVEMGGDYDYRSNAFKEIGIYYFINDQGSEEILEKHFHQLSGIELYEDKKDIIINGRLIPVKKFSPDVVWFDFNDLCNAPRSTEDYTEIASYFKSILISNIPVMGYDLDDAARRFINMIDTFYDMRINIVVSAEKEPEALYTADKLKFEFVRAVSRINEMQTDKYITSSKLTDDKKL
ncbi:cell division protein ZapE [Cocleimonas flava]|jgi:cell division protein ZapE|uniref:Cell division protein ZapE n=1 Tax=Cocleimonas flava TaxID=634765 RepID=A0A4R1EZP9_9GAMM|nr:MULTISPECIES: cell division protein ZapE [Cocleimonas]MEB8431759.1 cell division protein ZapE [Cocleimonas sp. KMM 6892]MEC4715155.1 cell division protein ZapE [Cocleimonas sp. KMM 6895]MEC4744031.1 cell division protein ZapE [Cocleimonas sp. KMM 6896]TCJ87377.1 cell division protein ZapE [Cocleimonas flava]